MDLNEIRLKIVDEIYPGWKNLAWPDPEIEEMAAKRVNVCLTSGDPYCPYLGNRLGFDRCRLCGCPLKAKVRSPNSKCPDNRW